MSCKGSPIKVTVATLKMAIQATACAGGFEITPPAVLRLECGSGPLCVHGNHFIAVKEEEEPEKHPEDVMLFRVSGKQSAPLEMAARYYRKK